jgi:mannan endo-1,4-beta-mannosidase
VIDEQFESAATITLIDKQFERMQHSVRKQHSLPVAAALSLLLAGGALGAAPPPRGFVTAREGRFELAGAPFRYGGANTYYLHYESNFMVRSALQHAADNGFNVLRAWAFMDEIDCAGPGGNNGVVFQCRDAASGEVRINDTALERLDYAIATAAELGVRLVLTFTNNWPDFGGMDTYLRWRIAGDASFKATHDAFYTDATVNVWYRAWIAALVTRTSSLTGVPYSEEPAIFAWQLANEPRCGGSGPFPASAACGTAAGTPLPAWVASTAAFVRSLDANHMISVGDEGFACNDAGPCPGAAWWCDCSSGVSSARFAAAPDVSYVTAHLYPESWGTDAAWGASWIASHAALAHAGNGGAPPRPFVVEEFGISSKLAPQHVTYANWTAAALASGADGFHFWMSVGLADGGRSWYPGDVLNVVCAAAGEPAVPAQSDPQSCGVLAAAASAMAKAAAAAAAPTA